MIPIIICSLTGLSLLVSGEWMAKGSTSTLTQDTFTGVFGPVGGIILTLCLVLFATTTILGWSYYGERCFEFYLLSNISIFTGSSLS